MTIKIPVYRPYLDLSELKNVEDCFASSWISSKGGYIDKFEKAFSDFVGGKYGISLTNGTVALHAGLIALGIGPGDEVIVPTFTYVASVNSIKYTGAIPVFVDSDRDTWQINAFELEKKITSKTKAILVVHLYGHPCEMNLICEIALKHNLYLIEDCAEAIGTYYKGRHVGTFGALSTFSFFGNKTITTGEGGMVVTNSSDLRKKIKKIKGQGLSESIEYWHDILGYNYRMTNICAAIGVAQLEKISMILNLKKNIATSYQSMLMGLPIKTHVEQDYAVHSYWMYSILVDTKKTRDELRSFLAERGIETRPTFNPVHMMPMYKQENHSFPIAIELGECGINLPSWPGLNESDLKYICDSIRIFYNNFKD